MNRIGNDVESLIKSQLIDWSQASDNYAALSGVRSKDFKLGELAIKVQFNPARIVSSAAKVDPKSIKERKCFLCDANRPVVQKGIEYKGDAGDYEILVNPFPIFPKHLTIPDKNHTRQEILGRFKDMLNLSKELDEYVVFYNGPKCGASAPDHMHFQAGNKGMLPLQTQTDKLDLQEVIYNLPEYEMKDKIGGCAHLYKILNYMNGCLLIVSDSVDRSEALFGKIYSKLDIKEGEWEPMLNILSWYNDNKWFTVLFLRAKHRPSHYFAEGDENILLSPASVDLGGVYITPLEKDFNKISIKELMEINGEVMVQDDYTEAVLKAIR